VKLLDTNVWFYAFTDSQELSKHERAKQLIALGDIGISLQTIGEVCNALLRKAKFDESQIQNIVRSFYKHYKPIVPTERDYLKASELRTRYHFSHWDSVMIAVALQSGVTEFYSEDMQDGLIVDGTLTIQNPFR
jgi:predicted nucleic acid-binding protein